MKLPSVGRGIGVAAIFVAAIVLAPLSSGQMGGAQQSPQQQQEMHPQPPPGKPALQPTAPQAEAPKVDPEEEKAYQAFFKLKPEATDQTIQLGEQFVQKYPSSKYAESVYARLVHAYFDKQKLEPMYAAADKALALNKDDVQVLVLVGWVIPHRIDPNDIEADRRLEKAEEYEKHALTLLETMPKPPAITDEEFAKAKSSAQSQAHSGLGLVYFRLQDPANSVAELQKGTSTAANPDPTDYLVMGMELQQLKRYTEAADAYDKCGKISGGLQDRCKQGAAEAKKQAAAAPASSK